MSGSDDRYDQDPELLALARSLEGRQIAWSQLDEDFASARVRLGLDDGRVIHLGVAGSLHDEAYLIFEAAQPDAVVNVEHTLREVRVTVVGGVVQNVQLPDGVHVIVRDYDVDPGAAGTDNLPRDEHGRPYVEAEWA